MCCVCGKGQGVPPTGGGVRLAQLAPERETGRSRRTAHHRAKSRQQQQVFLTIVIHAGRVTIGLETVNQQRSNHPPEDFVDCFGLSHPGLEKGFGQVLGIFVDQGAEAGDSGGVRHPDDRGQIFGKIADDLATVA